MDKAPGPSTRRTPCPSEPPDVTDLGEHRHRGKVPNARHRHQQPHTPLLSGEGRDLLLNTLNLLTHHLLQRQVAAEYSVIHESEAQPSQLNDVLLANGVAPGMRKPCLSRRSWIRFFTSVHVARLVAGGVGFQLLEESVRVEGERHEGSGERVGVRVAECALLCVEQGGGGEFGRREDAVADVFQHLIVVLRLCDVGWLVATEFRVFPRCVLLTVC